MSVPETTASTEPSPTTHTGDPTSARVLAAIGPDEHDHVLKIAWVRAVTRGLGLTVCSVIESDDQRAGVYERLADRVHTHLPADAVVDLEVRCGDRADQILASLAERETALLVVGEAHEQDGLLARIFWPSAATRLVRGASCPVLIARYTPGTGRVIAASALDDGLPVLHAAVIEVKRASDQVTVLHCLEPLTSVTSVTVPITVTVPMEEIVETAAARLKQAMTEVGLDGALLQVEVGPPAETILNVAKALAVDTIIVGTHGRAGAGRLLLGSVAEQVIRDAPCDVLVVRIE